jgi:hypothetical protein
MLAAKAFSGIVHADRRVSAARFWDGPSPNRTELPAPRVPGGAIARGCKYRVRTRRRARMKAKTAVYALIGFSGRLLTSARSAIAN